MGATIVIDQEAAAFKPEGASHTVWCLFEKLYDKNTYPHHPQWNCVAIGRLDTALSRVFESASYCEGGMNQGRNGHIRPETYIERWLNAMKNPLMMPDIEVPLALPAGKGGSSGCANAEAVRVSLHRNTDLVVATHAGRPWRAIPSHVATGIVGMNPRSAELGYRPSHVSGGEVRRVLASAPRPEMRRVDGHTRIERVDGVWKEVGWPYSIVGSYVRGLWRQELETPGVYKRLIGEYRKAVEAAPAVPAGTAVLVPLTGLDECAREALVKLANEAGGSVTVEAARIPWVMSEDIARVPLFFSGQDVRWEVPELPPQEADHSAESEVEPLEQEEIEFGR
jgi:hypothetical protein